MKKERSETWKKNGIPPTPHLLGGDISSVV
jgi:hypothetical protein